MRLVEHQPRPTTEVERLPLATDRKTANGHAVDGLDARLELVAPADVVARARCHHLDLRMPCQAFRDVAGVQLRSAVDIGAVALDDYREVHDSAGPLPVSLGGAGESPLSRRDSGAA